MLLPNTLKSKIQPVLLPQLAAKQVSLFVQREDLLHPSISGNKYRKLAFNIEEAKRQGKRQLLTFGGAYSNHVLATAHAGKEFGFATIGIIRGEELGVDLEKTLASNPTLRAAKELGMQFEFISRAAYRLKEQAAYTKQLAKTFPEAYLLPEGGSNALAVRGCECILQSTPFCDFIGVSVGTGGTLTGIVNRSDPAQQVLGFSALKGAFLEDKIQALHPKNKNWKLIEAYHFGGYAKTTSKLIAFINRFRRETGILLDPIYTGKMLFGLLDLVQKDAFPKGSKILAIHTGGLQAISAMNDRLMKKGLPKIEG